MQLLLLKWTFWTQATVSKTHSSKMERKMRKKPVKVHKQKEQPEIRKILGGARCFVTAEMDSELVSNMVDKAG
jgi:hypothetical protein